MNILNQYTFEEYVNDYEDMLMERWDELKYEQYSELFHYDDVDFWREDLFMEMAERYYDDFINNDFS